MAPTPGKAFCKRPLKLPLMFPLVVCGVLATPVQAAPNRGNTAAAPQSPSAPAKAPAADATFSQPYIDIDEWRDAPVRHRYVHGGFKGTDARFSFYLPEKAQYKGRFFQHITPVPLSENLAQQDKGENTRIGFAIASGGYFVESNEGGKTPGGPAIAGFQANAAVAQYSRVVAAQMYGPHRTYGYAYGGSGGAFKTISGFENTTGVWDGVVPFVIGTPMAIPSVFTVRSHALRVLKDKFPQIVDAADAGGSGDIYAGLNDEERAALLEVTRMGFPPRTWFAYKSLGIGALSVLIDAVVMIDPQYFTDFWTKPGYLGANPPQSLIDARVQHDTAVIKPIMAADADRLHLPPPGPEAGAPRGGVDTAWKELQGKSGANVPVAFELKSVPVKDPGSAKLVVTSGAAAGKTLTIGTIIGNIVTISAGMGDQSAIIAAIKPGDGVRIDNSIYLAAQTYHRHQVPGADYPVWNQFKGPDGKPLYPQRPMLVGPLITAGGAGSVQSGKFVGKMIVVESLMDEAAYPWQADWYRSKVKANLGDRLDDNFRLWFTDHALHTEAERLEDETRVVSYGNVLYQALRDVSAWVEKGTPPPANTSYKVVDGQVLVPATAAARKGIQPVITVKANGRDRAEVAVGKKVEFTAVVDVPPGTGKVVKGEWDFEGVGTFPVPAKVATPGTRVTLRASYTFTKPGTYFPVLRAYSQRDGDVTTPYGRIPNLGRVRVVVK